MRKRSIEALSEAAPEATASASEDSPHERLNFLGKSEAFLAAINLIRRLAPCDAPVLIRGETGTGKELAAGALHYWSERRGGPFIPVNCGAISDTLFESELFGHARGAFTDARERRDGLVAQARGGTLFLDELEALSPRGQVALLRLVQNQEYRPVGGALITDADVRVVGATNADLLALAERGEYRLDLVFRLNVLDVELPPLRARGDDVIVLAQAFLDRLSRRYGRGPKRLDPGAITHIRAQAWPGNVRELENFIYRAFLLSDGVEVRLGCSAVTRSCGAPRPTVETRMLTDRNFRDAKARAVAEFERAYIAELLARSNGNVSLAARLAGKERSRLGKLLRKYGLSGASFRAELASSPSL